MSTQLFPKNTFSLPRGIIKNCQLCHNQFSIFLHEHLCKRCHRTVCADCGPNKIDVYKQGFHRQKHRLCKVCKEKSDFIVNCIKSKALKFNHMSMIANKWLSKMRKVETKELSSGNQDIFQLQHLRQLWDSYSYQFRQFVGLLTYEYEQRSVYEVINYVYKRVLSTKPKEDIKDIIYLIVFCLCFATVDNAVTLTLGILTLKQRLIDQNKSIWRCLQQFPWGDDLQTLQKYIKARIQKHFNSFMINAIPMQSLIPIITKIIESDSYDEMIYFFCSHLFANRSLLMIIGSNEELLDINMLRYCGREEVRQNFKYFGEKELVMYEQEEKRSLSEIVLPKSFQEQYFGDKQESKETTISMNKREVPLQQSYQPQSFTEINIAQTIAEIAKIPSNEEPTTGSFQEDNIINELKKQIELKNKEIEVLKEEKKEVQESGRKKLEGVEKKLKEAQLKGDASRLELLNLKKKISQFEEQIQEESNEVSKVEIVSLKQKNSDNEESMKSISIINEEMKVIIKVLKEENQKYKQQISNFSQQISQKEGIIVNFEQQKKELLNKIEVQEQENNKIVEQLRKQKEEMGKEKIEAEKKSQEVGIQVGLLKSVINELERDKERNQIQMKEYELTKNAQKQLIKELKKEIQTNKEQKGQNEEEVSMVKYENKFFKSKIDKNQQTIEEITKQNRQLMAQNRQFRNKVQESEEMIKSKEEELLKLKKEEEELRAQNERLLVSLKRNEQIEENLKKSEEQTIHLLEINKELQKNIDEARNAQIKRSDSINIHSSTVSLQNIVDPKRQICLDLHSSFYSETISQPKEKIQFNICREEINFSLTFQDGNRKKQAQKMSEKVRQKDEEISILKTKMDEKEKQLVDAEKIAQKIREKDEEISTLKQLISQKDKQRQQSEKINKNLSEQLETLQQLQQQNSISKETTSQTNQQLEKQVLSLQKEKEQMKAVIEETVQKNKKLSKDVQDLKHGNEAFDKQRKGFIAKIQEISKLTIQFQEQKMKLSQELFEFKIRQKRKE